MHVITCLGSLTALCAAVGGIYSVIKSKAPVTTAEYGERYTLIGPLNHQSVSRLRSSVDAPRSVTDNRRLPSRSKNWNLLSQSWPPLFNLCVIAASVYCTVAG